MAIPASFLDELRARTTLSALIGRSLKLVKKGREHHACCPFHDERTPSFTVNDDKGFYHCFGCQAHGDAIRWLTDARGLGFLDAVKELADAAGLQVPAASPEATRREAVRATAADVLAAAADWYRRQLADAPKVLTALAERGIGEAAIARFGIGFAPDKASVAACGEKPEALEAAGLLIRDRSGLWRDRFHRRVMIPIHDARGRTVGFAGREAGPAHPDRPKYVNSPESDHFAKGDLLFNLHRAAPAAREKRRLLIVEGQLDVVALDQAGIAEAVAPMGTALTERQLERAWRVAECPILMMDGDAAGRAAAWRACERALPFAAPGRSLRVALLPDGADPDSLVRAAGPAAIEAAIAAASPLADFLWETLARDIAA